MDYSFISLNRLIVIVVYVNIHVLQKLIEQPQIDFEMLPQSEL